MLIYRIKHIKIQPLTGSLYNLKSEHAGMCINQMRYAINDPCIFMKTQDTDIFLHVICLSLLESIAGLDDTEKGG